MRDAFLQLLNGQPPDEIIWCADLTYWVDGNQRANLQGEEAHLRFCRDLGAMPYCWYGKFWAGEHMAARYRRRLDRLHAAGIRCAVHLDGAVRGLLPKLAAVGFDAIEAVTAEPCGDVSVDEMRTLAGNDRVILWGGVPGAMFAPPFTWTQMRAHVAHLLECWRGTRFIVSVADQVPSNGQIEFVKKIAEVINHG